MRPCESKDEKALPMYSLPAASVHGSTSGAGSLGSKSISTLRLLPRLGLLRVEQPILLLLLLRLLSSIRSSPSLTPRLSCTYIQREEMHHRRNKWILVEAGLILLLIFMLNAQLCLLGVQE